MPTFKAEVSPRQRADGTYSIRIRLTHNRKYARISTPWYAERKDLTPKLEIKSLHYRDIVEDKIREYRKICDEIQNIEKLTAVQVVDRILNFKSDTDFSLNFIEYLTSDYDKLCKRGRKSTAELRKYTAKSLSDFVGSEYINVNAITANFVREYIEHLKGENGKITRKSSAYPAQVRKALNDLRNEYNDEDLGVIRIKVNPFAKVKLDKQPETEKRALSIAEIQKLIDTTEFDTHREEFARDMFLLSFMLVGMNSADMFTCDNCSDGILTYFRKKVSGRRDDKGEMRVRIEDIATSLFDKYRNTNAERSEVFDFFSRYNDFRNFNKAINKGLQIKIKDEKGKDTDKYKIGIERLQFYAARHSWATIARNDAKIDKYTVHEALNHTDASMKVTDIYIKKDFSHIWEANKKVLALFNFV